MENHPISMEHDGNKLYLVVLCKRTGVILILCKVSDFIRAK